VNTERTADLESRFIAVADSSKQQWWTNYVKGAQFVGVPMAQVRSIAREWYREEHADDPVGLCLELGGNPVSEMKLAGIAIMEHELLPWDGIDGTDLERVRLALSGGAYDDWNTCDWLCVKVLGRIADGADRTHHHEVLSWTESTVLWEKRAGLVAFVNLLSRGQPWRGFDTAFLSAAGTVVQDQRRFAQTAVGWTLRELSHRSPERVRAFVDRYGTAMSSEARASASKFLDPVDSG
jgi:3-methyladenine DNA glycosylase AlkD